MGTRGKMQCKGENNGDSGWWIGDGRQVQKCKSAQGLCKSANAATGRDSTACYPRRIEATRSARSADPTLETGGKGEAGTGKLVGARVTKPSARWVGRYYVLYDRNWSTVYESYILLSFGAALAFTYPHSKPAFYGAGPPIRCPLVFVRTPVSLVLPYSRPPALRWLVRSYPPRR